ncbi:MAG: carboxypeptidase-like regulatory domain-containing protein [Armatimonadota bacterium]|nr:carboxypeptidase-like regulatory domain-containing protein [Armatimonadota bacterium]MCX7776613.1 carboxypeptidase-like regulatory domain-containing protein [Armatimonadota bacterium]MDW8025244.1 carboxypeptidase-like regulatory domain-containing protein [Armatimonadota bacterium]
MKPLRKGWGTVLCISIATMLLFSLCGCKGKRRSPLTLLTGTGKICGAVLDEDGVPLPKAIVYVEGLMSATFTDEQGQYTISGLPKGTYAVVAALPGYRKAVRTNVQVKDGKVTSGVDLTLVRDTKYEPDMIRFVEVSPPEGTRIECGKPVFMSGKIQYVLRNARWGTIYIFIVDEAGKQILDGNLSRISATAGERIVPFGRQIVIPQNVSGRVWLVAALFAGQEAAACAADTAAYSTGVVRDEIIFVSSEPPFGTEIVADLTVKLKFRVRCSLESADKALLKVELLGGTQSGRYTIPLAEACLTVTRSGIEPQDFDVELECVPRAHMPAVKAKASLISADGKSAIAAAWSPRFIVTAPIRVDRQ